MPPLRPLLRLALPLALGLGAALFAPVLRAGSEPAPAVLFDAKGLSRDWTPHSWGGLDIGARRDAADQSAFAVKVKENTEPYAGLTFKCRRGQALALDADWQKKGLVVVRIRLGTDFYGAPLKSLDLKLGLTLLLADGRTQNSKNQIFPIQASVDGSANPIVIVATLGELLDPSLASTSPSAITGLTLQHGEAPAGNFEIIECAFVREQD